VLTNKRQKPPPLSTRKSHIRNSNLSEEGSSWTEDNIFKEDDSFDEQHHHDNGFNFTSTPAVALINHDNNTVGLSTLNTSAMVPPPLSSSTVPNNNKKPRQEKRTQEADSDDQSSLAGSSVGSHRETRFERRGIFMGIRK